MRDLAFQVETASSRAIPARLFFRISAVIHEGALLLSTKGVWLSSPIDVPGNAIRVVAVPSAYCQRNINMHRNPLVNDRSRQ